VYSTCVQRVHKVIVYVSPLHTVPRPGPQAGERNKIHNNIVHTRTHPVNYPILISPYSPYTHLPLVAPNIYKKMEKYCASTCGFCTPHWVDP